MPARVQFVPGAGPSGATASTGVVHAVLGPVGVLMAHRELAFSQAAQRIRTTYRGSILGPVWVLGSPVLLMAVYTFVFSIVLEARWGQEVSRSGFALRLFAGLLVFNLLRECLVRAPSLLLEQPNLIKRVVFPVAVLPWSALLEALVNLAASSVVLLAFMVASGQPLGPTALLAPVLVLPLVPVCLAALYLIGALGVYLRDLGQVAALLATVLLFLCPVFYPLEAVPEAFMWVIRLNPLTSVIEWVRGALFDGTLPAIADVGIYAGVSWAAMLGGYAVFVRTRRGFADVV